MLEDLVAHEAELAKAEEQRIQSVETQAGAALTVILAIVAFRPRRSTRAPLKIT